MTSTTSMRLNRTIQNFPPICTSTYYCTHTLDCECIIDVFSCSLCPLLSVCFPHFHRKFLWDFGICIESHTEPHEYTIYTQMWTQANAFNFNSSNENTPYLWFNPFPSNMRYVSISVLMSKTGCVLIRKMLEINQISAKWIKNEMEKILCTSKMDLKWNHIEIVCWRFILLNPSFSRLNILTDFFSHSFFKALVI